LVGRTPSEEQQSTHDDKSEQSRRSSGDRGAPEPLEPHPKLRPPRANSREPWPCLVVLVKRVLEHRRPLAPEVVWRDRVRLGNVLAFLRARLSLRRIWDG
jgi:hypothetical protein